MTQQQLAEPGLHSITLAKLGPHIKKKNSQGVTWRAWGWRRMMGVHFVTMVLSHFDSLHFCSLVHLVKRTSIPLFRLASCLDRSKAASSPNVQWDISTGLYSFNRF